MPRWCLLEGARNVLSEVRTKALEGLSVELGLESLCRQTRHYAEQLVHPSPRRVLNATGIVLHTNLGRAPLARQALAELERSATAYSDLELDLDTGARGSRQEQVGRLLGLLSGAEAALVVNNTAAALLLAVDALAAGREVVLSRGEMVEIGGSFRVPEIMASSRAELREVGTTNRTHPRDYAQAIGERTGLLLKVHKSNFRVEGFTAEVSIAELARLGGGARHPRGRRPGQRDFRRLALRGRAGTRGLVGFARGGGPRPVQR